MQRPEFALVRTPALLCLAATAVAAVVGFLVADSKGLIAALLGGFIVIAFFGAGQYVVGRVMNANPQLMFSTALLVYITQTGFLLILLLLLRDSTAFDSKVFALTVVALDLIWVAATVVLSQRLKVLYVEPHTGPTPGSRA